MEPTVEEEISTETKSTFETIRHAIAHPITTLTDTIHNVLSTSSSEQIDSDSDKTAPTILEAEHASEEYDAAHTAETKTTLETIRHAIAHPLTTIGETIQSVISSSQSEPNEQVASDVVISSTSASEETKVRVN